MPYRWDITADDDWFTGKNKTIQLTAYNSAATDAQVFAGTGTAQAITGWALQFTLTRIDNRTGTALITKTVGSGITITNGAGGICQVAIADTDTDNLPGDDAKPRYYYELARTDAGSEDVIAYGSVVLRQGITT